MSAPAPAPEAVPADDFGFDEPPPPAERAAPGEAAAPESEAAAAEAAREESRRRRRRRGGRGRRRREAKPVDAGPGAEALPLVEEPEPDEFGALPEEPAPPAPPAQEPALAAPPESRRDAADRRASRAAPTSAEEREWREWAERGKRGERESRTSTSAAPGPGARAPRLRAPQAVDDWFSPERLDACQRAIRYHFRDVSLLVNALTHSSIKSDDRPSYERIEFLGDSVIGLVIAEHLYNLLPDCDEGELTKVKSLVVSTDGLAEAARACGLDRYLAVGRGILMKEAVPRSLIADVFEGVVGAVYLDRGYETVRLYVLDLLHPQIQRAISDRGARNFKSVLQQVAQREFGDTPYYEVLREGGPEHSRVFEVVAVVGRRRFSVGRAATKKEAEQAAAKLALRTILLEQASRKSAPRRRRSR